MAEYCEHVYSIMGTEICAKCGNNTHETNWEALRAARIVHRETYGIMYQAPQKWWSI